MIYSAIAIGVAVLAVVLALFWRPGERKERRKRKKIEFSKIVLALVMATYFFGVVIGVVVVLRSSAELGALLAFIGAPVATALGFYYWKAKNENVSKIKLYTPDDPAEEEGP
ncbi:hypothetical protein [Paenibacillus vini]|uniref:Uncharacterized protein n=1 Tax=Paenibacillus vini TaxID=1476024 RepID=A0ABQ4ML65_9BACL|nr:hypothetical protein [Paenibacillus vini]GIP56170.1 hypothetical protein J42TS3_52050 [Paenibacillus vini]